MVYATKTVLQMFYALADGGSRESLIGAWGGVMVGP